MKNKKLFVLIVFIVALGISFIPTYAIIKDNIGLELIIDPLPNDPENSIYRSECFDCKLPFIFTWFGGSDILEKQDLEFIKINDKKSKLKNLKTEWLSPRTVYKTRWVSDLECLYDNQTNLICEDNGYREIYEDIEYYWKQFSNDIPLEYGTQIALRIKGENPTSTGYTSVDVIPIIKGVNFTQFSWLNTSWFSCVNITIINEIDFNRNCGDTCLWERFEYNVTGLECPSGDCSNEYRVINQPCDVNGTLIHTQNLSSTDESIDFIMFPNISANATETYSLYFNNSDALFYVFPDLLEADETGDDKINALYYNITLNMDSASWNAHLIDGVNIQHTTYFDSPLSLGASSSIILGGRAESDDLCSLIYAGSLEIRYLCESGEDSNKNGAIDAGESYHDFYYNPYYVLMNIDMEFGSTEDWRFSFWRIPLAVDGEFIRETGSTAGTGYDVLEKGWYMDDTTSTRKPMILWAEDGITGGTDVNREQSGNYDVMNIGMDAGDAYQFPYGSSIYFEFHHIYDLADANAFVIFGNASSLAYDHKLQDNVSISEIQNYGEGEVEEGEGNLTSDSQIYLDYFCYLNNSVKNTTTCISGNCSTQLLTVDCINGCNDQNPLITFFDSDGNLCNPGEWLQWLGLLFIAILVYWRFKK